MHLVLVLITLRISPVCSVHNHDMLPRGPSDKVLAGTEKSGAIEAIYAHIHTTVPGATDVSPRRVQR